jgi:hypothetical protein
VERSAGQGGGGGPDPQPFQSLSLKPGRMGRKWAGGREGPGRDKFEQGKAGVRCHPAERAAEARGHPFRIGIAEQGAEGRHWTAGEFGKQSLDSNARRRPPGQRSAVQPVAQDGDPVVAPSG